ncbi:hypothetical protein [Methanocaldococcus sp.]
MSQGKSSVLLSIKPKYFERIIKGIKKYEFRKRIFNSNVKKVYLYVSKGNSLYSGKIAGFFYRGKILMDDPFKLWDKVKDLSGLTEKEFFDYFKNSKLGYAIEIRDFKLFNNPIDPKAIEENFKPPQDFCYLDKYVKLKKLLSEIE